MCCSAWGGFTKNCASSKADPGSTNIRQRSRNAVRMEVLSLAAHPHPDAGNQAVIRYVTHPQVQEG
jgi:hypothetical protein